MKTIHYMSLITGLFLLFTAKLNAQHIQKDAIFSGTFKYSKKKQPDSVLVWTYPNANFWDSSVDYKAKVNNDGTFSFRIPALDKPLFFVIKVLQADRVETLGWFSLSWYAEPGDDIHIALTETAGDDNLLFTGKGAAKYNLIAALQRVKDNFTSLYTELKESDTPTEVQQKLDKLASLLKTNMQKKQQLIDSSEVQISPSMRKLIDYQFARYDTEWGDYISDGYRVAYHKKGPEVQQILKAAFNQTFFDTEQEQDTQSLLSPEHFSGLLRHYKTEALLKGSGKGADLRTFYELLKHHTGQPEIKERLLSQFLMDGKSLQYISRYDPITYDSLVIDASPFLTSKQGKEIMSKKTKLAKGRPFYDTDFTDLQGNVFNTSALKGKVFIIDMWGTGCGGCAQFHHLFESQVWPALKDQKEFKFLSVNTDKDRKRWIESLNTGTYTSKAYLNVFTGAGTGLLGHSLSKYYEVNAAPFVLLVDKQHQIVAKLTGYFTPKELLRLINKAISER
ncbi:TlpA disulfide reductase family protein [Pedobacter foliorum]|uniref:TlpA family protein disulfide reductase n=1 Tax=Pedobacter foliorum TaxID=2739058 RepID=UPI00156632E1|nr:TlpA disulfide reductase family protein [Pedobacter foliorum]NRF41124.1 TlpA family protein disulfide reductase [Pedobacter foliorum]